MFVDGFLPWYTAPSAGYWYHQDTVTTIGAWQATWPTLAVLMSVASSVLWLLRRTGGRRFRLASLLSPGGSGIAFVCCVIAWLTPPAGGQELGAAFQAGYGLYLGMLITLAQSLLGAFNAGRSHHDAPPGPHHPGPYGQGPYGPGPYGQGPYGPGPGPGPHGPDPYGPGPYNPWPHGS